MGSNELRSVGNLNGEVGIYPKHHRHDDIEYYKKKYSNVTDLQFYDANSIPEIPSSEKILYLENNELKVSSSKLYDYQLQHLRELREQHFVETDKEFIRALSQNDEVALTEVKNRQKYLRDITKTFLVADLNKDVKIEPWVKN